MSAEQRGRTFDSRARDTIKLTPISTMIPAGQTSHGMASGRSQRKQPVNAAPGCIEEQVGGKDRENGPGELLASRSDQHGESQREDEQQAVGVGALPEPLHVARVEAAGGNDMIDVEPNPTKEGQQGQAGPARAVPDQRRDDDHTEQAVSKDLPQRGEDRVTGRRQERPGMIRLHQP